MKSKAAQVIDAIATGLRAGGDETDWDAPQFEKARRLTERFGCVWKFDGWRAALRSVKNHGGLGGTHLYGSAEEDANVAS